VELLGLRTGADTQLGLQQRAQPGIPSQRGGPVATSEVGADQLDVCLLVGGLGAQHGIPQPSRPRQLGGDQPEPGAGLRQPWHVDVIGKQLRGAVEDSGAAVWRDRSLGQRGQGGRFERDGVDLDLDLREKQDELVAEDDRGALIDGGAGEVRGLVQAR
jgi:hypothetical protein